MMQRRNDLRDTAAVAVGAFAQEIHTGRNEALLEEVKALAPSRVQPIRLGERALNEVVMEATGGAGVDAYLGAPGPGAPLDSTLQGLEALRRGGCAVGMGALAATLPFDPLVMMRRQLSYAGLLWTSSSEVRDMAAIAAAGTMDLSSFGHERFALTDVNQAEKATPARHGGFNNIVVTP